MFLIGLPVSSNKRLKPAQEWTDGNSNILRIAGGRKATVQLLLEKGAHANIQGGLYGNALQAASKQGHIEVVQLLLEKGAHVNAQGGPYGNALRAASAGSRKATVQLLLEKGAPKESSFIEISN